ncbi:G2 M phase-specific E3 ubiquitin- ligase-like, partial [Paramuricea clavata]
MAIYPNEEHLQIMQKHRKEAGKSVKEISIKFFCLASTTQQEVPNNDEKQQLLVAGLGEKKVTRQADSTSSDVVAALKETYPKLTDGGGYEFMYAKASSRQLSVIDEGENGYTIEFLKQFVGQGRVYIRPIQCDLDLKALVKAKDQGEIIEEICNHCMNIYPMNKLREHLYLCPVNNTATTATTSRNTRLVHGETGDPESTKMQDTEESDDLLNASLLFHEINAEYLSDEDTELIEEKVDENSPNDDEAVMDVSDILQQLASANIENEKISKFNICRSNICDGIFRGMTRKSFSPNKKLSVKFTDDVGLSEGAVDMGGPMREFFTLSLEAILSSKLFCWQEHSRLLSYDAKALKHDEYVMAGQLISMALVHAGVAPRCFSPVLFDSLIKGHAKVHVPVDAVYDLELQSTLKIVMSVESVDEANRLIADKKLEEIQELPGTLRVLRSISDVKDVLSNRWEVENRLLAFWRDFLLDVEEKECELSFSDILFFALGLRVVPCRSILLQLEFLHEPEENGLLSKFPKANTCSCILRLPVVHTQYDDFKSDFQFAVRNAKGF